MSKRKTINKNVLITYAFVCIRVRKKRMFANAFEYITYSISHLGRHEIERNPSLLL